MAKLVDEDQNAENEEERPEIGHDSDLANSQARPRA